MDYVLAKKSDSENITSEELRKVLAPFLRRKDKATPKKENDLLIRYCQRVHVKNMERRAIDFEKHNINAVNSTDCAYIRISDHAEDGLIANYIDAGDSTDCYGDAAYGLIATDVKSGDSTDFADIMISDYAVDGLIATDINAGNSTDCSDDSAGGLVASVDSGDLTDCTDITISDDAVDEFISADYGNSTDCADSNVSDDAIDVLRILMG